MRLRYIVLSMLIMLGLVLAACGGGATPEAQPEPTEEAAPAATEAPAEEPTEAPTEEPAEAPAEEPTEEPMEDMSADGSQELVIAIAQDIGALDIRKEGSAASFTLLRHVYEPLVWFNDDMELYPVLAESWEQIDDTTMRFYLREGATFHNGNPVTAEAVQYSLEQVLDPDFPAWMQFALDGVVESAEVVDDYTVDIKTTGPTPSLLWRMTLLDIVDPSYAGTPEMDQAPVGTGPFRFVSFSPRQELVLERNPDYYGEQPQIERLTARILPEAGTRLAALLAGEVQMINAVSPEMLAQIQDADNVTTTSSPTARLIFATLRNDRAPLDDVRVRQAMNYAIDKQTIVDTILKDIAVVAQGPLPPTLDGARTDLGPYPYDPEMAQQLLDEAGYNGEEIVFAVGRGRYPNDGQVAEAIAAYWEAVGLNVTFEQGDFVTVLEEQRKGPDSAYDAVFTGWSADAQDPVLMLDFLFHSDNTMSRTAYSNPDVDALINEAETTIDPATLEELLGEAQGIIWEDAPVVFLYHPVEVLGISENLKGFTARPDEFFFFTNASLEK